MTITTKCMTANLSISVWAGHRLDKDASRKVTEDAGAERDAARVNKHLIPKDAMKGIVAAQGAVRTHFYENTLPWRDNGDRLLTRARFTAFIEEHERLRAEFDAAVEAFLTGSYMAARDQAAFRMGAMFNPDDYPSVDSLRRKFGVSLDIDAVTEAGDFRVQMDTEAAAKVRAGIEAATEQRVARAMQDVWQRLADAVGKMAERLGDADAIFRDSMLTNLDEIVDVLPDLNVLEDPALEQARLDVKARLTGFDAATLRTDKATRAAVATAAQEIFDDMSGLMRAFNKGD